MSTDKFENLVDILAEFDNAMLVTRSERDEMRSRPMAIADCTDAARLWFVTRSDSGKIDELTDFPNVNVSMQDGAHFLSITGTARICRDHERLRELWSLPMKAWFEGPDDPCIVLLEIVPTHAEYWDHSGLKGVKLLLAGARAAITGKQPDYDESMHAKIDFPERQPES